MISGEEDRKKPCSSRNCRGLSQNSSQGTTVQQTNILEKQSSVIFAPNLTLGVNQRNSDIALTSY